MYYILDFSHHVLDLVPFITAVGIWNSGEELESEKNDTIWIVLNFMYIWAAFVRNFFDERREFSEIVLRKIISSDY